MRNKKEKESLGKENRKLYKEYKHIRKEYNINNCCDNINRITSEQDDKGKDIIGKKNMDINNRKINKNRNYNENRSKRDNDFIKIKGKKNCLPCNKHKRTDKE